MQEALESIVATLPKMAEYLASIPDGQKTAAVDAVERHYLQTALGLGCSEEPADLGRYSYGSCAGAARADDWAGTGLLSGRSAQRRSQSRRENS